MKTIKEVLRLKYLSKLSNRKIELLGLASKSAISNYTSHFEKSKLNIDEVLNMKEEEFCALFYSKSKPKHSKHSKPHPDWNYIHNELKKKGMTRQLLWEEYKEQYPNGLGITQFKEHYARFAKTLNPSMRQVHYSGDKLFVDFSGLTVEIVNAKTKEVHKAQIFVSVLGSSGYTFVYAVMSQNSEDFIECHNKAFEFYKGVPNQIVPDNLKAAVISHTRYNIKLNETYADMGRHYGVFINPARPYKPQDKSKVELGVKAIQRWILMRLRNHTFFSIDELNSAISKLLNTYNNKKIRRLNKSRLELFKTLDKPALHPLRANRYIYREHKRYKVRNDYHIEINGNGYSVPFKYLGKRVDVWYSKYSVVISYQSEIIATHPRVTAEYEDSTIIEHMPKAYQYQYEKSNPKHIINWALTIGDNTTTLMKQIMQNHSHTIRGFKICMAILGFSKSYGNEALELTCKKAIEFNTHSVSSIESMLKHKSYLSKETLEPVNNVFNHHANIRGKDNYQ
jgi:transposase